MVLHHLYYAMTKLNDDDSLTVREIKALLENRHMQGMRRGEDHHASKLTADDVRDIRKRAAEDHSLGWTRRLAEEYGVNLSSISAVVSRKTWRHVD